MEFEASVNANLLSSSFVNQFLLAFEAFYQLPLTARTVEPASLLLVNGW